MKIKYLDQNFKYDGSQLRSLYNYMEHGLLGDSMIAWQGPCDVTLDHMIDGEDKRQNAQICGSHMLHFILEKFDDKLSSAVALQRLLATVIRDEIYVRNPKIVGQIRRVGDDLYWNDKKLSISIATATPLSVLIHFAVNVSNKGTPVPTCSLEDFFLDPTDVAHSILENFSKEMTSIREATQKVFCP